MNKNNTQKIAGVVIAAIITTIMVVAILIPLTTGVITETKTNECNNFLTKIDGNYEGSVGIDTETGHMAITIGDEKITKQFISSSNSRVMAIMTDTAKLEIDGLGTTAAFDYYDGTTGAHVTSIESATFTIVDNTLTVNFTVSGSSTEKILDFTWGFVADDNGTYGYVSKYNGGTIYYSDINDVYSGYYTYTAGYFYNMVGETVNVNGVAATSVDITKNKLDGVGLYSSEISYGADTEISFDFMAGSTSKTTNVFNVVLPYEASALKDGPAYNLLSIIPVLFAVAIIVSIAMNVVINKRE